MACPGFLTVADILCEVAPPGVYQGGLTSRLSWRAGATIGFKGWTEKWAPRCGNRPASQEYVILWCSLWVELRVVSVPRILVSARVVKAPVYAPVAMGPQLSRARRRSTMETGGANAGNAGEPILLAVVVAHAKATASAKSAMGQVWSETIDFDPQRRRSRMSPPPTANKQRISPSTHIVTFEPQLPLAGGAYIGFYVCAPAIRATSLSTRPNPGLSWLLSGRRHKVRCWRHAPVLFTSILKTPHAVSGYSSGFGIVLRNRRKNHRQGEATGNPPWSHQPQAV